MARVERLAEDRQDSATGREPASSCAPAAVAPAVASVISLQRSAGNAVTARLLSPLAHARPSPPPLPAAGGGLSPPLQAEAERLAGGFAGLGGGAAVAPGERAPFERSFGLDLAQARMHVGSPAARQVTSTLGVEALTVGNHMVFAQTPPAEVLGHELAHVVQQSARPAPSNDRLRAAHPASASESDADRASAAALEGRPYAPATAGDEDVAMLAPLVWLAIAALVAGVGIGVAAEATGPSYEENRQRAEERHADDSVESWAHAVWLWVPVGGTATRIWEAQSTAERVFNIVMMPVDVLTLGALGSSFAKVANRTLWQTAIRQGARAEVNELATAGMRAVTQAEVQAQARVALESGQAVIATVGRRNHAIVFVKVAGRYYRLSGGAMRSMRVAAMESFNPTSINAFYAFGGAGESAAMLAEAQQLARFWGPGIGFSFRSCGISAARLAETGGLNLGLSGGRAYLPVTVMGALSEQGMVTLSSTGARRMLGGTALNYALMGTARGGATVVSNPGDVASSIVHRLVPGTGAISTPGASGGASTPLPGVEVSEAAVFAALDGGLDVEDIALGDVAPAYLGLRSQVAPEDGGADGAGTEIVPVYTFIGAASEQLASQPPTDMGALPDLTGLDPAATAADAGRILEISREPSYRDGARRLRTALNAASARDQVLDRAHDYFPFTFPSEQHRAAAAAALERESVTGDELVRAQAALSR